MAKYMEKLLRIRNQTIRQFAENGEWKKLPGMMAVPA
jgi:hypothetical protein